MSLWAIGMPSSLPRSPPDICRASAALASASARSSVTRRNALRSGSPTSALLHVEGQRGFGFARQRRVHARDHSPENLGAWKDCPHLIGRKSEARPDQHYVEFSFVDRGSAHGAFLSFWRTAGTIAAASSL